MQLMQLQGKENRFASRLALAHLRVRSFAWRAVLEKRDADRVVLSSAARSPVTM